MLKVFDYWNYELCVSLSHSTNWEKKAWEALNAYFSNELRLERKLYFRRRGLMTRETEMRDKLLTQ